jgi:hypothetical protein
MPAPDPWLIALLSVAAMAVGLLLPGGWCRRLRWAIDRPVVAATVVALANLGTNLAVAHFAGVPQVHVQDEYGYLLIADTLRHGRLANPTPADPDAFASPHLLLRPTYAAKYPPAQGVALAIGETLGDPVYGVWIVTAAAAVAVWWMLLAFVPPPWALLGGLVTATHPTMAGWGHMYWGGGVAVLGGAVVAGACGRLVDLADLSEPGTLDRLAAVPKGRSSTVEERPFGTAAKRRTSPSRHGILLGLGLIVLANSRPYEGLVLSVPLLAMLAWRWRRGVPWRPAVGLLVVLLAGGAIMAAYNRTVTGSAGQLPIVAYAQQYDIAPKFWFLSQRSSIPAYPNHTMAWTHLGFEEGEFLQWQSLPGALENTRHRALDLIWTIGQPGPLLLPLLLAAGVRGRRVAWMWATVGLFAAGMWAETFYLSHYAAPAAAVAVLLVIVGWRRLHAASPRLARGVLLGYAVGAALTMAAIDRDVGRRVGHRALPDLLPALRTGRHLIFVRYTPDHRSHDEWVYNGADLQSQPLLWAHDAGPAADRAVVRDYPGRQVWLLTMGLHDLSAEPYRP